MRHQQFIIFIYYCYEEVLFNWITFYHFVYVFLSNSELKKKEKPFVIVLSLFFKPLNHLRHRMTIKSECYLKAFKKTIFLKKFLRQQLKRRFIESFYTRYCLLLLTTHIAIMENTQQYYLFYSIINHLKPHKYLRKCPKDAEIDFMVICGCAFYFKVPTALKSRIWIVCWEGIWLVCVFTFSVYI